MRYIHIVLAVSLSLLTILTPEAFAQGNPIIHGTQAEVDLWKTRRTTGPYEDEWTMILGRANAFRTSPEARWTGQTTNTCYNGNSTTVPGRTQDAGLRDAGFVYLLTGDTTYRNAVRTALLAQASVPGTNFGNTARWCPTTGTLDGYGDYHQAWLRRLAYGYSYIKNTLSAQDIAILDAWFLKAGRHIDTVLHNIVKKRFPNRLADNYAACSFPCPGDAIGITHFGGPTVFRFNEAWSNKATAMNAAVAVIGVLVNDATLKANAKRLVKEWIAYATWPGGQVFDQFRWGGVYAKGTTTPQHGFLYTGLSLGSILTAVDHLARDGDLDLLTYTTSTGLFGSAGGPKSLLKIMQHYAGLTRGTIIEYASTTSTTNANLRIDPAGPSQVRIEHVVLAVNLYYQDASIKLAYSQPLPSSWSTVGCDTRGGDWCAYPGLRFMYGGLEGKVSPYSVNGTTSIGAPRNFVGSIVD